MGEFKCSICEGGTGNYTHISCLEKQIEALKAEVNEVHRQLGEFVSAETKVRTDKMMEMEFHLIIAERDRLINLFEKVHAEAQVPDETSDIAECKDVCGFILGFAQEALNHKEG